VAEGHLKTQKGRKKISARVWMFGEFIAALAGSLGIHFRGSSAFLRRKAEDFFQARGYAVVQGYGMDGDCFLISLNPPFRAAEGSVGKDSAGPGIKLAEDGAILVRGENGSAVSGKGRCSVRGSRGMAETG